MLLIANWISAALFMVLSIAVYVKPRRSIVDNFLMAAILCFTTYMVSDIWVNYDLSKFSFAFHSIAAFSMFPPFFLYAMLLISRQHKIKTSWWWFMVYHFAYALFIILDVFILKDYSVEDIDQLYHSSTPHWSYLFFYKGLQLYTIAIMIWFLSKLRRYQRKIQDYYSNLEGVRLNWLKYFSWIYIVAYGTSFVTMLIFNFELISDIKIPYFIINISIVLALFWMFYRGLKQHALANFSDPDIKQSKSEKYATSSLSQEVGQDLYKMILELFEEERIFHNPDLKVQDIAGRLGATNHNVSQVLNEIAGKSFYDFVNDFRLNYFKEQLADPEKRRFTILALGMESGFNSKASINRIFKQNLGETPREFQQRMLA